VYRPRWFRERNPDHEYTSVEGLFFGSPQYVKAMRASLPLDRWPVIEERYEFSPERKVFLVLRDGTEIDSGGTSESWLPERRETRNLSTTRKRLRHRRRSANFVKSKA
jgi:hypothetical protein